MTNDESAEAWIKFKIQDNANDLLLRSLKVLIYQVEGTDEYWLFEVLDMTFMRRAEDRSPEYRLRKVCMGYDERATIPTDGSPVPIDTR